MTTNFLLLVLALLPDPSLAVSNAETTPGDPAAIREEITGLEGRLAEIAGGMKTLKAKDYDALTDQERADLMNLAWDYDQVARRIEWRHQAISGGRGLASERHPAANRAVEHLNGTCPFVTEALTSAAGVREDGIRWKDNGMLELKDSITATVTANSQSFSVRADGLGFPKKGPNFRTNVRLQLGDQGKLSKLRIEQANFAARWYKEIEFDWQGDSCELDRVNVGSPDIAGRQGISYDRGVCKALEGKGLLDEKKIGECTDFNDAVGTAMEKAMRDWGDNKVFALFVNDPMGATRLKPWKKKDHVSVNAQIARDCIFHLKKAAAANPAAEAVSDGPQTEKVAPAQ